MIYMMAVYKQGVFILRNLIKQTTFATKLESIRSIKRWVAPTLRELQRRKDKLEPQEPNPRSSYLEWNYQAEIYAFGKRLNEEFNPDVLQKALTNRSYVIKEEAKQQEVEIGNPNISLEDNSSLIREGEDFILNTVKKSLEIALPKFPQEGINAVAKKLTSDEFLSNVALNIGLKDLILASEYPPETSTLSSTFKAIIAALLHSSGEEKAKEFVIDFVVLKQIVGKDINEMWRIDNPFEMLSELLKAKPEARLCNHSGGNTILAAFQVGLYVDKACVGMGYGESIEIAKEMAARDGLKRLFGTTDSMPALRVKKSNNYPQTRAQVHY